MLEQDTYGKYEFLIEFLVDIFNINTEELEIDTPQGIKIVSTDLKKLSNDLKNRWVSLLENSHDFSSIQKEYIQKLQPWKEKFDAFKQVKNKSEFIKFLEKYFSTWMKLSFQNKDISRREIFDIIKHEKPLISLSIPKYIGSYKSLSILKNDFFGLTAHLKLKKYKTVTYSLIIIFSFWFENIKDTWKAEIDVINKDYQNSMIAYEIIKKLKSMKFKESSLIFESQEKGNQFIISPYIKAYNLPRPSNNLIIEILSINPIFLFEEFVSYLYSIEDIIQFNLKNQDLSPHTYFKNLTLELQQFLLKGKELFLKAEDFLELPHEHKDKINKDIVKEPEDLKISFNQIIAFFKDALERDKTNETISPEDKGFRTQNQIFDDYKDEIDASKPTFYNYFDSLQLETYLEVRNKSGKGGGKEYKYKEFKSKSGQTIKKDLEFKDEEDKEDLSSERIEIQGALSYYNNHYYEKAIQIFEHVLHSKKLSLDLNLYFTCLYYLGRSYFKIGNYKKALESFDKIYMKNRDLYNNNYALAESYLQLQDNESALLIIDEIILEIKEIFQKTNINLNLDYLFVAPFDKECFEILHPKLTEEDIYSEYSVITNKSSIKISPFYYPQSRITQVNYDIVNRNIISLQILYKKYLSSVILKLEILRREFFNQVLKNNNDKIIHIVEEFISHIKYIEENSYLYSLSTKDVEIYISYYKGLSKLFKIVDAEKRISFEFPQIEGNGGYPKNRYCYQKFNQYYSSLSYYNEIFFTDFENRDRIFHLVTLSKGYPLRGGILEPILKAEYYFLQAYVNLYYLIDTRIQEEEELNNKLDFEDIMSTQDVFKKHDDFHSRWFGSRHPKLFIEMAEEAHNYCKRHKFENFLNPTEIILNETQKKYEVIEKLRFERRKKGIDKKLQILSAKYNERDDTVRLSYQMKPKEGFKHFVDIRIKREIEKILREKIGNIRFNIRLFNPELNKDVIEELRDIPFIRESVEGRTRAFFMVRMDFEENISDNSITIQLAHFRDLRKEGGPFGENLDKINWLIYNAIGLNLNSFTINVDPKQRERFQNYFSNDFIKEYENISFEFKIVENLQSDKFEIQIKKKVAYPN